MVSKKKVKIFLSEDFFQLPPALSCEYLREFSKKFEWPSWYNQGLGGN
jgi:hypothetical protein